MSFANGIKHFKTITHHRHLVMKYCFKAGMYKQGLLHDLSKYSPSEFFVGAKYYLGTRSPNDAERRDIGYSSAWLHHKGRNKHHYEHWTDYIVGSPRGTVGPVPMPKKYIAEMFCDRVAACRTYHRDEYQPTMPLEYYNGAKDHMLIHPDTKADLEMLLNMCFEKGEDATLQYIKKEYLKK